VSAKTKLAGVFPEARQARFDEIGADAHSDEASAVWMATKPGWDVGVLGLREDLVGPRLLGRFRPRRIDVGGISLERGGEPFGDDVIEESAVGDATRAREMMKLVEEGRAELRSNRREDVAIGVDRPSDIAGICGGSRFSRLGDDVVAPANDEREAFGEGG
jgi:hypothetical protein